MTNLLLWQSIFYSVYIQYGLQNEKFKSSIVFVVITLLALGVTWPNHKSDNELSLHQSDEVMMVAGGEFIYSILCIATP